MKKTFYATDFRDVIQKCLDDDFDITCNEQCEALIIAVLDFLQIKYTSEWKLKNKADSSTDLYFKINQNKQ